MNPFTKLNLLTWHFGQQVKSGAKKIFNLALSDPKAWNPSLWNLRGSQSESGEQVDEDTALTYSAFWNAVNLIAGPLGSLPLHLIQQTGRNKKNATDQSLYHVLHTQYNPYMTAMAGRECLGSHVLTWGNGYAEKVFNGYGEIAELWPIPPNRVMPKMQDGKLVYEITIPNSGEKITLPREKILHIPGVGFDGFMGYSIVAMARKSIGLGMAMETFGSHFFGQGTHPGVIVSHPNKLDPQTHSNLKKSLTDSYSGLGQAHKLMLLEDAMKIEKVGISPEDSQFLECVTPDTLLSMADGTRIPAKNIAEGDNVLGWEDDKLIFSKVKTIASPKIKNLIKIKTARGRELVASEDHPCLCIPNFRTPGNRIHKTNPEKWVALKDLTVGNNVRVGLGAPEIDSSMSFMDAYFLGAMVGDGYIRSASCTFCSDNAGIVMRIKEACESLGGNLKLRKTKLNEYNYDIITNGVGCKGSKIRNLFNKSGLVGKHSHTKFVPEMILSSGPIAWKGFLSGFFDADGSIRSLSGKQNPALYWSSTSIELLDGCQHMLAMLGIQSAIYKMYAGGRKEIMGQMYDARKSWGLYIMGNSPLMLAADCLDLAHDEKKKRLCKHKSLSKSRYREINFQYDRVVSIESLGNGETIGIEIDGCHTHITGGIITHNSRQFQITDVARWFNLPVHKLKEMSKSSFNNIYSENASYVVDSLLPWFVRFEQNYNIQLLSKAQQKQGLFFKHNFEGLLRASTTDRAAYYKTMISTGVMTPNECREKEDLNPSSDPLADELFMPTGNIPLSKFQDYLDKNNSRSTEPIDVEPEETEEIEDKIVKLITAHN